MLVSVGELNSGLDFIAICLDDCMLIVHTTHHPSLSALICFFYTFSWLSDRETCLILITHVFMEQMFTIKATILFEKTWSMNATETCSGTVRLLIDGVARFLYLKLTQTLSSSKSRRNRSVLRWYKVVVFSLQIPYAPCMECLPAFFWLNMKNGHMNKGIVLGKIFPSHSAKLELGHDFRFREISKKCPEPTTFFSESHGPSLKKNDGYV